MNHELAASLVTAANVGFTCCRIAAHVPQLIAVIRDQSGARAISVSSWTMFAMANSSNAIYALVLVSDWLMFAINLLSAMSCLIVATVAFIKQRRTRAAPVCSNSDTGSETRACDAREERVSLLSAHEDHRQSRRSGMQYLIGGSALSRNRSAAFMRLSRARPIFTTPSIGRKSP